MSPIPAITSTNSESKSERPCYFQVQAEVSLPGGLSGRYSQEGTVYQSHLSGSVFQAAEPQLVMFQPGTLLPQASPSSEENIVSTSFTQ